MYTAIIKSRYRRVIMCTRKSPFMSVVSVAMGVLLLFAQFAFCAEPTITVLGDVVGNGKTEMKAAFNQWISVSGKPYPVIDGAHLKSGDGAMSIVFRDGARLEAGKYTDFTVAGSKGSYSITMESGAIGFSVPQGVAFSVTTPTSTIQAHSAAPMIQKASLSSQGQVVKGVVSYSDKGTKIMAVSGTLMVRSGIGVAAQTVSEGNAIFIEKKSTGKMMQAQRPEDQRPSQPMAVSDTGTGKPTITPPPPTSPPSGDWKEAGLYTLGMTAVVLPSYLLLARDNYNVSQFQ